MEGEKGAKYILIETSSKLFSSKNWRCWEMILHPWGNFGMFSRGRVGSCLVGLSSILPKGFFEWKKRSNASRKTERCRQHDMNMVIWDYGSLYIYKGSHSDPYVKLGWLHRVDVTDVAELLPATWMARFELIWTPCDHIWVPKCYLNDAARSHENPQTDGNSSLLPWYLCFFRFWLMENSKPVIMFVSNLVTLASLLFSMRHTHTEGWRDSMVSYGAFPHP